VWPHSFPDARGTLTERDIISQLRARRLDLGLTMKEAAEAASLKASTIWRIETGQSQGYLHTVLSYAHALGITINLTSK